MKKNPFNNSILGKADSTKFLPLVIVGPSGTGKGTLIDHLTKKYPTQFGFSVSFTTRPPRKEEVNGKHYNFVDRSKFEQMIADNDFIEYAEVHTNLYGSAKSSLASMQEKGVIPILDIDIQGAKKVRDAAIQANYIFICPPSIKTLEERIRHRG